MSGIYPSGPLGSWKILISPSWPDEGFFYEGSRVKDRLIAFVLRKADEGMAIG